MCAQSLQSCLNLCDPVDCSRPGSSVHGILQARVLEWVAMPFSRGLCWPEDRTCISCLLHWPVGSLPLVPGKPRELVIAANFTYPTLLYSGLLVYLGLQSWALWAKEFLIEITFMHSAQAFPSPWWFIGQSILLYLLTSLTAEIPHSLSKRMSLPIGSRPFNEPLGRVSCCFSVAQSCPKGHGWGVGWGRVKSA